MIPEKVVREHFEALFFSESLLGQPSMIGTTLVVPVSGVLPLGGFPLVGGEGGSISGTLMFRGVVSSRRIVTEYIGNPKNPDGFKEPYVVEDIFGGSGAELAGGLREYGFEGTQEDPRAWIDDWVVRAKSFEFDID